MPLFAESERSGVHLEQAQTEVKRKEWKWCQEQKVGLAQFLLQVLAKET